MRKTYLPLSDEDRDYLKALSQKRTIQAQVVDRARILLYKADGMTFQQIADKLAISTATVRLCISKFQKGGLDAALFDVQRPGRPSEITDDAKAWMIHIACQRPTELGYAQELWTLTSLHKYIQKHAEEAGYPRLSTVTKPYIQKFLKEQDMKPFKIKYYCEKRDPDFESKMHEVLLVYKQIEMQFDKDGKLIPFEKDAVHTLSYDEKPGIQAIATTGEDRPPIPNTDKSNGYQRDYEYVRLGTLSLLAAIDLLSGEAIPLVSETHKSSDFVTFLKKLDEKYPKGDMIRIILDNHSAHTSKETQEYLNTVSGRFEFVFTPKHGSWLNMIEGFFSKMTKQMLGGIRVESKKELEDRIYRYFDEINKEPVPYKWTYKMDTIDLSQEDIDSIVYEVVNAKAASAENKNKKAPKPISRKRKSIQN